MISYLLEVSICWLGFYLVYALLLSKETFFKVNRLYLLGSLLLGILLPLVDYLPEAWFNYEEQGIATVYLQPIHVGVQQIEEMVYIAAEESNNTFTNWLLGIYALGVAFFLSRFFYGLRQIFQLYKGATIIKKEDHILVLTNKVHYPFSFFNHMFWSEVVAFKDDNDNKIIDHEKAHIDGWHSADVVFVELLCVLFWCSPMVYFYKKSIRVVHEYLADALVLQSTQKKQYGQLLLRQSQSGLQIALANNFFHSQLKKRIAMMTKNKSTRRSLVKYALAIPMLLLLITLLTQKDLIAQIGTEQLSVIDLFNENEKSNTDKDEIYEMNVPLESLTQAQFDEEELKQLGVPIRVDAGNEVDTVPSRQQIAFEGEVFKVVEEMPRFPGCEEKGSTQKVRECATKEMLMYIYKNIRYPKAARENDIQGSVVVQFVVDKEGNALNPKIMKGIGGGCDEEVLRLVSEMPVWIPGKQRGIDVNVAFNLPVRFKLEGNEKCDDCPQDKPILTDDAINLEEVFVTGYSPDQKAKKEQEKKSGGIIIRGRKDKAQPIFFVNGERVDSPIPNQLNPDQIKEISVLKGESAIAYAGEDGKDGVILITLKTGETLSKINLGTEAGLKNPIVYVNDKRVDIHPDKINSDHIATINVYKGEKAKELGKDAIMLGAIMINLKPNVYLINEKGLFYETRTETLPDGTKRKVQVKIDPAKEKYWSRMRTSNSNASAPPPPPSKNDLLENKNGVFDDLLIFIDNKESNLAEFQRIHHTLRFTRFLPSKTAIAEYGRRAKNGVLEARTISSNKVFKVVEEMPRFPGCETINGSAEEKRKCANEKMLEFIYQNVKYPKQAKRNGTHGMAVVSFIVDTDGKLTNIKTLRSLGDGIDEEVLRLAELMNNMPQRWTPGKQRGKTVKVQFNVPIRFKIDEHTNKEEAVTIDNNTFTKLELQDFKAFPNPTEGKLNINFQSTKSPVIVTITDISGKEIFRENINDFDGIYNKNIDVTASVKGALFLNVFQDDKVFTTKVIHQ